MIIMRIFHGIQWDLFVLGSTNDQKYDIHQQI